MSRWRSRIVTPVAAAAMAALLGRAAPPPPAAGNAPPPPPPAAATRLDIHGDPLPPHALARMGSVRLRHYGATDLLAMPDGRTLVTASGRELRFWEVATGRPVRTIAVGNAEAGDWATSVARSGDGRRICTGHADGRVRLWDVAAGRELWSWQGRQPQMAFRQFDDGEAARGVAVSADGKVVLTAADGQGVLHVLDAASGRETGQLVPGDPPRPEAAGNRNGDARPVRPPARPAASVLTAFALSDDGTAAAGLFADPDQRHESPARVVVWDVATRAVRKLPKAVEGPYRALALSGDGTRVALAEDDAVAVRDLDGGREVWRVRTVLKGAGDAWAARRLAFGPAGVVGVGQGGGTPNGVVALWDAATGAEIGRWAGDGYPRAGCVVPATKTLAVLAGSAVRLWDAAAGRELLPELDHPQNCGAVAVSADGKVAVSCGTGERTLRAWDVATGREIRRFAGGLDGGSDEVGISRDGKLVAASEHVGLVRVWDAATGELLHSLNENGQSALLRFTPDGLGTAAYDRRDATGVRLWDAAAGTVLREPRSPAPFGLAGLLASADGRLFGVELKRTDGQTPSSPQDHYSFRVWDAADERVSRVFRGTPAAC